MVKVSIVIPLYKYSNLFRQCMDSIAKYSPEAEVIVIRSDGSFAENCNRGIAAAKGEYICLLNDDIVVTENWLQPLIEVLDNNPKAGAVSPMMLFPPKDSIIVPTSITIEEQNRRIVDARTSRVQFGGMVFHEDYCGGHLGWGWKENDIRLLKEVTEFQATTFGCVLLRKEAINHAVYGLREVPDGLASFKWLDENYIVGGFEDIDLSFRLRLNGWKIFFQPNSKIFHLESRTFNTMDQSHRTMASNHNRELYLERWSPYFENGTFKIDDVDFPGGVWKGYVE